MTPTTEDGDSNSCDNDASHTPKGMQSLSGPENSLPMPPPLHEVPLATRGKIMPRHLKRREQNRERQRRFRARKRFQADARSSSLLSQGHLLLAETQELGSTTCLGSQGVPPESQSSATMNAVGCRFHCSRKWKTDARQAHTSEEPENSCGGSSLFVKPPLQKEPIVHHTRNPTGRRHWKAEARTAGM